MQASLHSNCRSKLYYSYICVYSRLWTAALDSRKPGSKAARDALCDSFYVAREVAGEELPQATPIIPRTRPLAGTYVGSNACAKRRKHTIQPIAPNLQLQSWLPYDVTDVPELPELGLHQLRVPHAISLDPALFQCIDGLSVNALSKVYSTFFQALWKHACRVLKSDARYSNFNIGRIQYIKMTPLWLRNEVTFIRGHSSGSSFPFTLRQLPLKNIIRERGNKKIGSAILTSWLMRHEPGSEYLLYLLRCVGACVGEVTPGSAELPVPSRAASARANQSSAVPAAPSLPSTSAIPAFYTNPASQMDSACALDSLAAAAASAPLSTASSVAILHAPARNTTVRASERAVADPVSRTNAAKNIGDTAPSPGANTAPTITADALAASSADRRCATIAPLSSTAPQV